MIGVFYLQSSYSMLKNTVPIEELILTCVNENYDFVALSDEYLHGVADLYKLTKENNIKPILGMTIDIKTPYKSKFLLYVKNDIGYENLLKLTYLKSKNHEFSLVDLITNKEGLIFITAGYDSVVDQTVLHGNENSVEDILINLDNSFDDFYIGLSFNYKDQIEKSSSYLYKLSQKLNIPKILVHQTSYLKENEREAYEALIKIEDSNNEIDSKASFKFLNRDKINEYYNTYPQLKIGTQKLVSSINFSFDLPKFTMPEFLNKKNVSSKDYLKSLARMGLKRRLKIDNIKDHSPYIKRLEHELNVIISMNFEEYFLIVYDFIYYAKNKNILVGPGRGSAAGSLVSYCLGITNVDPIKYRLMFERFLNPERTSMPDIDVDFPDNKREEVIEYVKNKYGENHIASISTYGTFALRSSIRDIARVIGIDSNRVGPIIQSVINERVDNTDSEIMKLLDVASKIEGLPRQTGTHAAGIILSKQDLRKYIPMQTGSYNFQQSQLDADWLEKLGLIKIDFLGIRNLTIIADILDVLNKDSEVIDINDIPLNDIKTYKLLSLGETTGIFQLESQGMRNVLRKLKPNNFEDIIAVLALYRPGPMDNIDTYIKRRGGAKYTLIHESLRPSLESTYGIIVYQEQIMQIAQEFAGYNLFEADMLRVGISKKDRSILENERKQFVKKSLSKGHTKKEAETIYDYIVKFADYGFNRSHSVSYSLIAYQMAYLKANYYNIFMATLLNHVIGNESQTRKYIDEIKRFGYIVEPPNLNISTNKYVVNGRKITMPLTSIRGIGKRTYEKLSEERSKGSYDNYLAIKQRLSNILSQNEFETLISSGALDFLGINRRTMLENSDLSSANYEQYMTDFKIRELEEFPYETNIELESKSLGFNLKYSLLSLYEKEANKKGYLPLSSALKTNKEVAVLGMIKEAKEHTTKNNKQMLFLTITDTINDLEVTVFPETFNRYKEFLKTGVYAFYIKSNIYNNERRYTLNRVLEVKANK